MDTMDTENEKGKWSQRAYGRYRHPVLYGKCYSLSILIILVPGSMLMGNDWLKQCGNCRCSWMLGKKIADCRNLTLQSVPDYLSSDVQVLDLSQNQIAYLEEQAFFTTEIFHLHRLLIRNGSLKKIHSQSFFGLDILIELDLSNNRLPELMPNVFEPLSKVRSLMLNKNLLQRIQPRVFHNLKYLHKIELRQNRLINIEIHAFVDVPLLSEIYLDGNELTFLVKESFQNLTKLSILSLGENPWNCTCDLQPFRNFLAVTNLYTPYAECRYPVDLRGLHWISDQPVSFACRPKIVYPAPGVSINTSRENVTLVCRVLGSANTVISWDFNNHFYKGVSTPLKNFQERRVYIEIMVEEQSKEQRLENLNFISRLTLINAGKGAEGVYSCIAESPGGKDSVHMSVVVPNNYRYYPLNHLKFFPKVLFIAFVFLCISIMLTMVTCCLYRRYRNLVPRQHSNLFPDSFKIVGDKISCESGVFTNSTNTANELRTLNAITNINTGCDKIIEARQIKQQRFFGPKLQENGVVTSYNRTEIIESNLELASKACETFRKTDINVQCAEVANDSRKQYNMNVQKYLRDKFGSFRISDSNKEPRTFQQLDDSGKITEMN